MSVLENILSTPFLPPPLCVVFLPLYLNVPLSLSLSVSLMESYHSAYSADSLRGQAGRQLCIPPPQLRHMNVLWIKTKPRTSAAHYSLKKRCSDTLHWNSAGSLAVRLKGEPHPSRLPPRNLHHKVWLARTWLPL